MPSEEPIPKAADPPLDGLVSIILTTLNGARYLRRSVDSCLAQTGVPIELVVVDGGSTDGTLEILADYGDPRLRIVHQAGNAGKLPGAINLGLGAARGEFITWTQDDSWYAPEAMQTLVGYLAGHPEVGLVYADYWIVDEAGQPIRHQPALPPEQVCETDAIGQCFLFRRAVYEAVGPQDPQYFPVHELPWRAAVARRFAIRPLHLTLMHYTLHPGSLTGRIGPWELRYMATDALYRAGFLRAQDHRRLSARAHVDHAYDLFILRGHYRAFWGHAAAGMWRDAHWLGNLGLWKLLLRSLLPGREAYRLRLLAGWQAQQAVELAAQLARAEPAATPPATLAGAVCQPDAADPSAGAQAAPGVVGGSA
jgi:glycosyltransferase involved in cell wall biosynthesis